MKTDKFIKIMLALIFLVLSADLLYRMGIIEWRQSHDLHNLPIQLTGTRVRNETFNNHYHKVICDCAKGDKDSPKEGGAAELITGPPIIEGSAPMEEYEEKGEENL